MYKCVIIIQESVQSHNNYYILYGSCPEKCTEIRAVFDTRPRLCLP